MKEIEKKLKEKNEENNNTINELNKNNNLLQKENNELKAKIIKLKNINKEAEKLSQIIINKDLEIEQLKLKKNELKNNSTDLKKEKNKGINVIQNLRKEIVNINELNNSIENLKNELITKDNTIKDLNKTIKLYEEEKNKENDEINKLKEEIVQLNKRIEELKNDLIEKKREIKNKNDEIEIYKREKNTINESNKNSQLIMEITSLKKINSNLSKQINDLKKKNCKTHLNSMGNDTSSSQDRNISVLNEKIQNISEQNKDLTKQIHKISSEKLQPKDSNNDKDEQIKKMQTIIDDLNAKINDFKTNKDNIKEDNNKININDSQSLVLSHNSLGNEIVNYNSKEIKTIDVYKKMYEDLKNQFDKYKNEAQIEISIYKSEFKNLKKEKEELKYKNKNNQEDIKKYSPQNYNILCDKNYEKLQWFLLIPKDVEFNNDYDELIWVQKKNLDNLEKFNKFESEDDIQNKAIINNVKKLEQKEDIISKLKYKLNLYEKNSNFINDINNNNINKIDCGISLDKYNKVLNELNNTEEKLKLLQQENKKLKQIINGDIKKNKKFENTEGSYNIGYNKKYEIQTKEEGENDEDKKENENKINTIESEDNNEQENETENFSESNTEINELRNELENTKIELRKLANQYKNLENKLKILKEACSNYLIKINIPKKYKNEIKEILKLFEFSENEILFIVDKKKQF